MSGDVGGGGLIGLSNLGNTCYMNAALQCLSNTPTLTEFFLSCSAHLQNTGSAGNGALAKAYLKLMKDLWTSTIPPNIRPGGGNGSYVAPMGVLHAIKSAHPMFRGFHQHDAQEFLRCFMDTLHEELMEPLNLQQDEDDDEQEEEMETSSSEEQSSERGSEPGEEYETADSGVSEDSSLGSQEGRRKNNEEGGSGDDFNDALTGSPVNALTAKSPYKSAHSHLIRKRKAKTYRSVISDIFDGKLVSTVQCLTCDRVSTTAETFQDLSLPIPNHDAIHELRHPPNNHTSEYENDGWMSWMWSWLFGWFYGPNVSLNDCLAYFFSADELKGDNMYSCEKCKKLRNGLKYSRVTELPDTLCIHLKRFRHEFAFSSKIGSKVTFPLVGLDMAPWVHSDCKSKETTYDLTGIVCHQGTAGGGHYVAYCLNPLDQEWYEFDDSIVTRVDLATVLSVEAYVLFYRKNNESMESVREEMINLRQHATLNPTILQFHVSNQWINKFHNFSEPGSIDNSDFLCPHGGVQPLKAEYVHELYESLPQSVWEFLHERFGGGPACTRIYECVQCRNELDALNRQKKFELDEFKQLYAEFKETEGCNMMYCMSSSWFKLWEGFVMGRNRDPPGPIDNKAIVTTRNGAQTLRTSSDYLNISHEIWCLFHSIYGGGPEVVFRLNGITVTTPRVPSLPAPTTRIRARSTSEAIANKSHSSMEVDNNQ